MTQLSRIEQFFTDHSTERAKRLAETKDHFRLFGVIGGEVLRYSMPELNTVSREVGRAVLSHINTEEIDAKGEIYVVGGDLGGYGYEETIPFVRITERGGEPTGAARRELVRGEEYRVFMTSNPSLDSQEG